MVNKAKIDEVYGDFGNDFIADLFDTFISEFDDNMLEIENGIKSRDLKKVERKTHSMKTSCGQLYDAEAYRLATELNFLTRNMDETGIDELYAAFKAAANEMNEHLKELKKEYE